MRGATNLLVAGCIASAAGTAAVAQTPEGGNAIVEKHVAAARASAGPEHVALFDTLCSPNAIRPSSGGAVTTAARGQARGGGPPAAPAPRQVPPREQWHVEPVKVFDNLYFVGQSEYSAWAVITSEGVIVIDTIFDYSVEEQVVNGLRKLGQDPAQIKYVIVSHGHGDHSGGAKFLQDRFKARVIMGEPDWALVARSTRDPAPRKDMIATDGMKLTLGDTTLTLHLTPGHTPGTVSTLVPVKDGGRSHLMAEWGGTAFNFARSREAFQTYIDSAARFREIVARAGADGIIANHLRFDGSTTKLPALATRKAGQPHPYVIGNDAVQRYLRVAEECAKAAQAALP